MGERKGQWIRTTKRVAIYARDSFRCVYCGEPIIPGSRDLRNAQTATLDHVLAVELGGTNDASNLVCCCARCNAKKGALPLKKFLATLPDPKGVARRVRNATRRSLTGWTAKAAKPELTTEAIEPLPTSRIYCVTKTK